MGNNRGIQALPKMQAKPPNQFTRILKAASGLGYNQFVLATGRCYYEGYEAKTKASPFPETEAAYCCRWSSISGSSTAYLL